MAISRRVTRPSFFFWAFLASLMATIAITRGQDAVCKDDTDCADTEVCLSGLCYIVQAAPPGTELVKCEDVCPDTGKCIDNVCVLQEAGETSVTNSTTPDKPVTPVRPPAETSGSGKAATLGLVGVILSAISGVLA